MKTPFKHNKILEDKNEARNTKNLLHSISRLVVIAATSSSNVRNTAMLFFCRLIILLLSLLQISSFYLFQHSITKTSRGRFDRSHEFPLNRFFAYQGLNTHFWITQANGRISFNPQYQRVYSLQCFTHVCCYLW